MQSTYVVLEHATVLYAKHTRRTVPEVPVPEVTVLS